MKREDFIATIRARLGRGIAEPVPEHLSSRSPTKRSRAELVLCFGAELSRVGGALHRVTSTAALESALIDFARAFEVRSGVGFGKSCFERFELARLWREVAISCWERGSESCGASFRARCAAADIGISVADLGVAASGSMLFLVDAARPRAVTLLPRSHVAILTADALVPDLAAAMEFIAARGAPPSSALFITGPSRTSDIENDLTLGVHGPAAVTVFLLDN